MIGRRLLNALIRRLPRHFADRFAGELRGDVAALQRDARRRGGRTGETIYLAREIVTLWRLGRAERRRLPHHSPQPASMLALGADLGFACRSIRRRPLVTLTIAATLAIAVGSATTAAGLARAVLWRPLPFVDAERVVFVWEDLAGAGTPRPARVTGSRFAAWHDHARSFDSLALFGAAAFSLEGPDGAASVGGLRVSPNYFDTIGIAPVLGRGLVASDGIDGQHRVLVMAHEWWQQGFGGRSDVIDTTVRLSGQPYVIVGVMPPAMFPGWPVNPADVTIGLDTRQFWVPIARRPAIDGNSRSHVFGAIARLAAGVSREQAEAELRGLSPSSPDGHAAQVRPLRSQLTQDARQPLLLVLASALALLMAACANLTALNLAAFERRRSELATRASLGAGTGRLIRLLTVESLVVAAVGGTAGIAAARSALRWLPAQLPPTVPFVTTPEIDASIAAFAAGLSVIAGLALAAWPVMRLVRGGPAPRGVAARGRRRTYDLLVAAQLAISVALVSAAAWLGQSLWSVQSRNPGFVVDDVVVANVAWPVNQGSDPAAIVALEDRLRRALGGQPGVHGTALAYDHPLEANWTDAFVLSGELQRPDEPSPAQLRIVSASYFDALGVAVIDGHPFTDDDGFDRPGVAVVNDAFARRFGGPVIGRRLVTGSPRGMWGPAAPGEFTIVGMVENERFRGLEAATDPAVYLSTRQFPQASLSLLVRTTSPRALASSLRAILGQAEPRLTVDAPEQLAAILATQLAPRRLTTDVLGGFAGSTLLLAGLGLYGLLALMVAAQTREVGLRLALGATPSQVGRAIVWHSLRQVSLGLAAGLIIAAIGGRFLASLLVDVTPRDPLTIAVVVTVMALTAIVAAAVPALRAARVDPIDALRTE